MTNGERLGNLMERAICDETQNERLGELTSFLEDCYEKVENGTLTKEDVMQCIQLATEFKKQIDDAIHGFEEVLFMMDE